MLNLLLGNPIIFALVAIGLVIAITIHEFAHAWMADHLGDPTPRMQGRVSLNPLVHLDPLGTLALLLVGFGWGRPVEFDPYNLRHPLRDTAIIALAGPASNLVLAVVLGALIQFGVFGALGSLLFGQLLFINVMLAIFNLIPVYPLDGSKILLALLPRETAYEYDNFMHRYGMFVLLLLVFPWAGRSPVSVLILPVINLVVQILTFRWF